ncbi:MAG TPA: RDD family protein [Hyalangium sp.]|nr:RDD family protein [Hyalangium sp.]
MELSPSMVVEVASNSSANFFLRLAARLLDVLFGVLLVFVANVASVLLLGALKAQGYVPIDAVFAGQLKTPAGIVGILLGGLLYTVTAEAVGGATLGKIVLRLRVTSENLKPSTFKGALLRSAGLCVDALVVPAFLAMSRSLMSQRVGDRWGHTVVLRASAVLPGSRKGFGLVALGVFSGSMLWMLCVVLFLLIRAV